VNHINHKRTEKQRKSLGMDQEPKEFETNSEVKGNANKTTTRERKA